MKGSASMSEDENAGALIDARFAAMDDWRGAMLARMRALIRAADPDVVETIKWRKPSNPAGVPVWEHAGILCTGEAYGQGAKAYIKLTFMNGAALDDPKGVFNSGLDSNSRRVIDLREGDAVDEDAFQAIIRQAVALNVGKKKR